MAPTVWYQYPVNHRVLYYPDITTHALRMAPMGARKGLGPR